MIGARKEDYCKHEWVLTFQLEGNRVWEFWWLCVDFVAHVSRGEKKAFDRDYPYQAVQVHPPIRYPPPPFKIDRPFITAFKQAVVDYGGSRIQRLKNLKPSARFLQSIHSHLP